MDRHIPQWSTHDAFAGSEHPDAHFRQRRFPAAVAMRATCRFEPTLVSPPRAMRCACQRCGAHTVTTVGYAVAGNCPNCSSYELVPVEIAHPS